jgi:D-3-phosphoglycerate dehydrogenase / 2-oxoglutarate reductase
MNILIAEPLAAAGIAQLRSEPGWNVIVSNPGEFAGHLASADVLMVRSGVKVDAAVLAKAPNLRVIGRAGVGVDNVDLAAATAAGVLVMNTPGGNAVSVAEHTLALMLAMARSIPQASASTKSGKWEKRKFLGTELRGKTLGVIGLGNIGRQVVRRALPFDMRIVASDPYVASKTGADLDIEMVDLAMLYEQSDYITLHVALTRETYQMLSDEAFARMKTGVRVVNCARGELIDSGALNRAIEAGKVVGAALDVFQTEPPAGEPLLKFDCVIATPHIGGSTEEAQEIVGVRIAEQVRDFLLYGIAVNAVNMPPTPPDQYRIVGPYIQLAERLGCVAAHLASGNPRAVRLCYSGRIADQKTQIIRNAGLAGVLRRSAERANVVNAPQIAADRGLVLAEQSGDRAAMDSVSLELETDSGVTAVKGAMIANKPRLIEVDGISCEAPLAGHMILMKNADMPGVIGYVGTELGASGINIATFALGREDEPRRAGEPRGAIAVVETDEPVPDAVITKLMSNPAIRFARSIDVT